MDRQQRHRKWDMKDKERTQRLDKMRFVKQFCSHDFMVSLVQQPKELPPLWKKQDPKQLVLVLEQELVELCERVKAVEQQKDIFTESSETTKKKWHIKQLSRKLLQLEVERLKLLKLLRKLGVS
jgi:NTP pyrophosphatase (non-canonical NTP hydrolase)